MFQSEFYAHRDEIIKVIGIGGGGCNAVNYMYEKQMKGVNFFICNTDAQCLEQSHVENKIHIGPELTQGLGAGSNPEVGRQATLESEEYLRSILEKNTKMIFITAGMGGGTGTGGAPIIAKIAKELGILTIGIVTMPFKFEGKKRMEQAEEGVKNLKNYVDTLIIISNERLKNFYSDLTMSNAFSKADNILLNSAQCITDVINTTGKINVDFADVCTVMRNGGVAIFGSAERSGENRAENAIKEAISSPLLNDNDISGAKWILLNISSPKGTYEITMEEIDIIQAHLRASIGENSDIILGTSYNETLTNQIGITLIATNFQKKQQEQIESGIIKATPITKIEESTSPAPIVSVEPSAIDRENKTEEQQMKMENVYLQTSLFFDEDMENNNSSVQAQEYSSQELEESNKGEILLTNELEAKILQQDIAPSSIKTGFSLRKPTILYQEEEEVNQQIVQFTSQEQSESQSEKSENEVEELPIESNISLHIEPAVPTEESDMDWLFESKEVTTPKTEPSRTFTSQVQPLPESNTEVAVEEAPATQQPTPLIEKKLTNFSVDVSKIESKVLHEQPSYLRNEAIKNFIAEKNKVSKPSISGYGVVHDEKAHSKINALNKFLFGHKPD